MRASGRSKNAFFTRRKAALRGRGGRPLASEALELGRLALAGAGAEGVATRRERRLSLLAAERQRACREGSWRRGRSIDLAGKPPKQERCDGASPARGRAVETAAAVAGAALAGRGALRGGLPGERWGWRALWAGGVLRRCRGRDGVMLGGQAMSERP